MARPVWTPIVAPDLGDSAIRAQQASGQALNQAFSGIGSVLDRFEAQRREANLAELYARQNRFAAGNDVTGYMTGLADGTLTGDLRYLKSGDIAGTRSFANELRNTRNADTAFARGEEAYNREQADRASGLVVARERNAIAADLAANRITPEVAQARAAALALQTENAGQVDSAYGAVRTGIADQRNNTNWERDSWRFGNEQQNREWTVEDRQDARVAAATIEKFRGLGGTFTDLEASDDWQRATPQQRILMRQAFGATANPGPFAGSIEMDQARNDVTSYLQQQGASSAAIAGIMGNLEVEGGYGGAQGDGGSASGIAQWRGPRRDAFRQRFGKDPHQATAAEQAQFLTWELLSEEGRKVSGVTQAQAREIWTATDPGKAAELFDKYYERSDGKSRDRRIAAARSFAGPSAAQNLAATQRTQTNAATQLGTDGLAWMANLPQAFADNSSLVAVAERITGKGTKDSPASPLSGQNADAVQRELRYVQDEYARRNKGKILSPAAAAVVLEQSAAPFGGIVDAFNPNKAVLSRGRTARFWSGDHGAQYAIDREKVRDILSQIRFDSAGNVIGLNDTVRRVTDFRGDSAQVAPALAQVEALRLQVQTMKARDRELRRFDNPATRRMEEQLLLAQRQLDQINGVAQARSQIASGPRR